MSKRVLNQYIKEIEREEEYGKADTTFTVVNYNMPENAEMFNLAVISGINFGTESKFKAEIKKLLYHIKEIEKDPNAVVILNGELTSFIEGDPELKDYSKYNYDEQVETLAHIFEPIKDKILVIADGETEAKILKKDGFNLLLQLSKRLGIGNRYAQTSYFCTINLNNKYTDNKPMKVNIVGEYGTGVTNTLRTTNTKNQNISKRLRNADIVVSSVSKLPMLSREQSHVSVGKQNSIEKKSIVYISSGNYRKYTDTSVRKKLAPYYTDNFYYPCFIAKNLDYINVRGTGQISEPQYKIYVDQMNFGEIIDYEKEYRDAFVKYKFEQEFDSHINELIKSIQIESAKIKAEAKKIIFEKDNNIQGEK